MPAPRFSVVIAAFNAQDTIASAVDSALAQSERDLEVVVVDDGSDDRTVDVVRGIEDARVRVLSQENRGQAAARNVGIESSSGRYVAFLDSDDLWLPDYLELAGEALDRVPNCGFLYTDAYVFDARTGRVRKQSAMQEQRPPIPPPLDRDGFLLELLSRNFVYVSGVVPRSVLVDTGGYTAGLRRAEDYDLWLRILVRGYAPVWLSGRHALYRVHPSQLSRHPHLMTCDTLAMFKALDPALMPTDRHRKALADRIGRLEREVRITGGEARIRHALRELRHGLGWVRQRLGLAYSWYSSAPPEVATAFPDLRGA